MLTTPHMFLDLVLLDKKSAGEIRTTLRTMLTDSERRQALIQELIKSNNQLKSVKQRWVYHRNVDFIPAVKTYSKHQPH